MHEIATEYIQPLLEVGNSTREDELCCEPIGFHRAIRLK